MRMARETNTETVNVRIEGQGDTLELSYDPDAQSKEQLRSGISEQHAIEW